MVPGSARNWIAVNAVQQSSLNKKMETKNITTLHSRKSIDRSPLRLGFLLIPLVLGCFALLPTPNAFGVTPAPDGGYFNGNTAEGTNALDNLTSGVNNTALGNSTLSSDTIGSYNTATGFQALRSNTANNNTADGHQALFSNTTGISNTATGSQALFKNTGGHDNVATGRIALFLNTQGSYGTASG
jgi:hypothetical protein